MDIATTDARGVIEVFDADAYLRDHPTADVATCGACERSWDDAVSTAWTPTPSGRCPFEDDHEDDPQAFTLTIELGNAAMQEPMEVAAALRDVADRIEGAFNFTIGDSGTFRDGNGNTVGRWEVS